MSLDVISTIFFAVSIFYQKENLLEFFSAVTEMIHLSQGITKQFK